MDTSFEVFYKSFISQIEKKYTQVNLAVWLLETTGSSDAAHLKASLDGELKLLLSNKEIYQSLLEFKKNEKSLSKQNFRILNVLLHLFKQNQVDPELLLKISAKESELALIYSQFRPKLFGKVVSENDIREVLKKSQNMEERKAAWEASKEVGKKLSPLILELVHLRNRVAKSLGYSNYFEMQLDLQEVDSKKLFSFLQSFANQSEKAWDALKIQLETYLCQKFKISCQEIGPHLFSDPFFQEDPIDSQELDLLVKDIDIVNSCTKFYEKMGIDVASILKRSDMYERAGKNQHAFCIHIDRLGDIRTLNNVTSSMRWLETVLHEYGHAIYEKAFAENLPWILREPPHMITTEAMALLAGRQAYLPEPLAELIGDNFSKYPGLVQKAKESLLRRQLIFSRFVLIMTDFESQMYANPDQDLQDLWWTLIEKYQKISRPIGRESCADYAAKYHIGLAPVYYFSYLLGEVFASSIQKVIQSKFNLNHVADPRCGKFLSEKLFSPGNSMPWDELVQYTTGKELSADDWIENFGMF